MNKKAPKDNEWYTPPRYIEAARRVMGSIDLDPASCEEANRTVKAACYYTEEMNGLALPWYGNVWMNPPFNMPGKRMSQYSWGLKGYEEYKSGRVSQIITTMYSTGKNKWLHQIWELYGGLMNIPYKRAHFMKPGGDKIELLYSVFFAYLGPNEDLFIDEFFKFGTVARWIPPSYHLNRPRQLVML